jgi:hypothetical protein
MSGPDWNTAAPRSAPPGAQRLAEALGELVAATGDQPRAGEVLAEIGQ